MKRSTRTRPAKGGSTPVETDPQVLPPDPVVSLILWALACDSEAAAELAPALGIDSAELERFSAAYPDEVEQMQQLRIAAELMDRRALARLVRVRLAVKLIETDNARELAALSAAVIKLPGWVFDEQADQLKTRTGNGHSTRQPAAGWELDFASNPRLTEALAEAKRHSAEWEAQGLPDV